MVPSREISDEHKILRPITREKGSRSSDLQLEQLVIAMALNDIKEMKETVDANCNTFKKEVHEIWSHLQNAKEESEALEDELGASFKRLKKIFFEERPKKPRYDQEPYWPEEACARIERLDCEVIAAKKCLLKEVEGEEVVRKKEVPIIVDLLRMIRRELEDLGRKTKENTDDMLKEVTRLKKQAQHLSLKSMNEGLDKKFLELEELINGCCTIKKIPHSIFEGSKD